MSKTTRSKLSLTVTLIAIAFILLGLNTILNYVISFFSALFNDGFSAFKLLQVSISLVLSVLTFVIGIGTFSKKTAKKTLLLLALIVCILAAAFFVVQTVSAILSGSFFTALLHGTISIPVDFLVLAILAWLYRKEL